VRQLAVLAGATEANHRFDDDPAELVAVVATLTGRTGRQTSTNAKTLN
jgi:hypothetical protein